MLRDLFGAMQHGGRLGFERIDRFNGGLFDADDVLPLEPAEIKTLLGLAKLDWSAIEPSIFGTLFVRGLDPDMRGQLGAHYTDTDSIMRIVNPVIVEFDPPATTSHASAGRCGSGSGRMGALSNNHPIEDGDEWVLAW